MGTNQKLDIVYHVMGMPFDGETIKTQSLGGSESAAYYQARELARRGHRVIVFTNCRESKVTDGVTYIPLGDASQEFPLGRDFEHYARHTPHDVLISQRHPLSFQQTFASKLNFWQLHDLALLRTVAPVSQMLWNIDAVTTVSEWHKKQVGEVWGIDPDFIDVVPNGVDLSLYVDDELGTHGLPNEVAGKFVLLYQSRPERGLAHLVRPGGIMDKLRDTNAHLLIVGYDNTTEEMAPHYAQWFDWAKRLPNVTHLGALTKAQLAALQKSCDLLCYPTEFLEVSCITAMEAMAAGLPMLTTDAGALPETCEGSGTIIIPLKDDKVDEDAFVDRIQLFFDDPKDQHNLDLDLYQLEAAKRKTWEIAVDQLEIAIAKRLRAKRASVASLVRTAIEQSDIAIAKQLLAADESANAIDEAAKDEIESLYAFAESPEAYKAHYEKHQAAYYDGPGASAVGEDVTHSTRFRATGGFLYDEIRKPTAAKNLRVLDYGCAHGHYLIPLAKDFKHVEFTGIDISARAIGAAVEWAKRDDVRNARFIIGTADHLASAAKVQYKNENGELEFDWLCPREKITREDIDPETGGAKAYYEYGEPQLFDVIIAGEVLEHVPDYLALLETFRMILKPGGKIIVTTPDGRWEWTGTKAFRHAREHLWHFDRADIMELCGDNPVDLRYAPAGQDQTGRQLGSWVWSVTVNSPFVEYDKARKLDQMVAARQTISACLIVKDGETTIRRCVESFVDWVDQIVIGVDPATTDGTKAVIDQLVGDYPLRAFTVFDGIEATKDGFYAARNATIERACGDWILWLDADEEIQKPWALWKLARPSEHRAFGFPQVHYACDPPQVLTTDYPCRFFRNDGTIKFYGFVHEHPEVEPGKAIPHATIRHDVQFLHCGYVDEGVRRKRYERNLPLLVRDLKEFPTRKINKFLWLRDIAQGIMFSVERQGGGITEAQIEQAKEGLKVFTDLVDEFEGNSRMIIDAVTYYSQCVMTLRTGFEAELMFSMMKPIIPDLKARCSIKGWFHSFDLFSSLTQKLLKEGAKNYDSKYL